MLRGIVASAAKLRAAAEARRHCATASAGTATSGGSHVRTAAVFPAPISNAGKRWACFASWIAAPALAPAGTNSNWQLTWLAEAREKISPAPQKSGSAMPVGPDASTPMAHARRAVTRRKGRTGRLNRRKATSIASVMPSTGNAVMASLADVMRTGRPDRNSDSARSTKICARSPSKLAFVRPLIIRPSRQHRQTIGRNLAKWGAEPPRRERSWRAAVVRHDR
jgi:hypothetical protein